MLQIIPQLGTTFLTVTDNTDSIYSFATLDQYPLKQRIIIRVLGMALYITIAAVGATVRFKIEGNAHFEAVEAAGQSPIFCSWHDRNFLGTYFLRGRKIAVLTSQSFDGEYIARCARRFGFGAIRGSSSRGGAAALAQMVRLMRNGIKMGITVDGPRGPRHVAKFGAVSLAKKTGNPIIPFMVSARSYKELRSWDKMQVPFPFTRADVHYGKPIYVPADGDEASDNAKLAELQAALDDLASR